MRKLHRDELITRARRADEPVENIEIIFQVPEKYADGLSLTPHSKIVPGRRMTDSETLSHSTFTSPGFKTLGWQGSHIPPMEEFGCTLEWAEGKTPAKRSS